MLDYNTVIKVLSNDDKKAIIKFCLKMMHHCKKIFTVLDGWSHIRLMADAFSYTQLGGGKALTLLRALMLGNV